MSEHIRTPSDDLQHIRFEGTDVCIISPEDYDALKAERETLRALLEEWSKARSCCHEFGADCLLCRTTQVLARLPVQPAVALPDHKWAYDRHC